MGDKRKLGCFFFQRTQKRGKKKKKSVRRKRVMVLRERTFKFGLEEHFDSVESLLFIGFNFMVVPYLVMVLSNLFLDIIAPEDDYDNIFLVLYTEGFL